MATPCLIDLSFFEKNLQNKDNNNLISSLQGQITCAASGNGFIFVSDEGQNIFKLDHHITPQKLSTQLQSICFLQASQTNSKVLAASHNEHNPASYSIVLPDANDFTEDTDGISRYQVPSFDLAAKTKSGDPARLITASPSLTYIAFLTGNDIQVFKAPHSSKSKPTVYSCSDGNSITNFFIIESGRIFYTTETSTSMLDLNTKVTTALESIGAKSQFAFIMNSNQLAVCRDKTITLYNTDKTKEIINWPENTAAPQAVGGLDKYFYTTYPIPYNETFCQRITVIDPIYKVIAFSHNLPQPAAFVNLQWGALVLILSNKEVSVTPEAQDKTKIDYLCKKKRFELALKMAKTMKEGGDAVIADIHRLQGDDFYASAKYDQAIDQYIETLGFTEPSHVIQKFVEPQHAEHLMKYLVALQDKKLSTKQHTTLLFNCYTKVKATKELEEAVNKFIEAAKSNEEPSFDVKTAVDVLMRNNYKHHAEELAKAYHKDELYISLLYEEHKYKEILEHIQTLDGRLVKQVLSDYGSEIMDKYPEGAKDLTDFCVKCCTEGIPSRKNPNHIIKIQPDSLSMIFMNNDSKHFDFLYKIFQTNPDNLTELIWNVLIEMALRSNTPNTQIMQLLEYPNAKYSNEQALVYLTEFKHVEGKRLVYEKMGLYTLILQEANPEDVLDICLKYGAQDKTLWSDALVQLSNSNCNQEILSTFLEEVQNQEALPFLTILKVLRTSKNHKFKTILPIVQATFKKEQDRLRAAETQIKESKEKAEANDEIIQTLSTQNFVIKQPKCMRCKGVIDEESNHFLCGHHFHYRCLGNRSNVCPECLANYETIINKKISKMKAARDQENVRKKLDEAEDGFQFLLQQVSDSLFASGVDLKSKDQDDEKIKEAEELLKRISPE